MVQVYNKCINWLQQLQFIHFDSHTLPVILIGIISKTPRKKINVGFVRQNIASMVGLPLLQSRTTSNKYCHSFHKVTDTVIYTEDLFAKIIMNRNERKTLEFVTTLPRAMVAYVCNLHDLPW